MADTKLIAKDRASRGFTLIELVMSIAILATVMSIVYGTFAVTLKNVDAVEREEETYRRASFAIQSMIRNFSSAYISYRKNRIDLDFVGSTQEFDEFEAARVLFFSTGPIPGAQSIPSPIKMVIYDVILTDKPTLAHKLAGEEEGFWDDMPEIPVLRCFEIPQLSMSEEPEEEETLNNSTTLARSTDSPLDARDFGAGIDLDEIDPEKLLEERGGSSWQIPISEFNLEFIGEEGSGSNQWSAVMDGGLPRAVLIQLSLASEKSFREALEAGEELETQIFETMVALPLGMSSTEEDTGFEDDEENENLAGNPEDQPA